MLFHFLRLPTTTMRESTPRGAPVSSPERPRPSHPPDFSDRTRHVRVTASAATCAPRRGRRRARLSRRHARDWFWANGLCVSRPARRPAPTPSPRVHPPTSPIRPMMQLDKIDMTDPATVAAVVAIGVLGLGMCIQLVLLFATLLVSKKTPRRVSPLARASPPLAWTTTSFPNRRSVPPPGRPPGPKPPRRTSSPPRDDPRALARRRSDDDDATRHASSRAQGCCCI